MDLFLKLKKIRFCIFLKNIIFSHFHSKNSNVVCYVFLFCLYLPSSWKVSSIVSCIYSSNPSKIKSQNPLFSMMSYCISYSIIRRVSYKNLHIFLFKFLILLYFFFIRLWTESPWNIIRGAILVSDLGDKNLWSELHFNDKKLALCVTQSL